MRQDLQASKVEKVTHFEIALFLSIFSQFQELEKIMESHVATVLMVCKDVKL